MEAPSGIRGVNEVAYRALTENRHYRVASDEGAGPYSTDFRRWGLATPQGFDPFLPAQYYKVIAQWTEIRLNRIFAIDFKNDEMLQTLGVRYVFSHHGLGHDSLLAADPNYQLIGPDDSYYRVYEYKHAKTPYGWEDGSGDARPAAWMPEYRAFHVRSDHGGRFYLIEQYFPGWQVTVDGRPGAIERWKGAFQAVYVGPGEHRVVFEYHSRYLLAGSGITIVAFGGLAAVIVSDWQRKRRLAGNLRVRSAEMASGTGKNLLLR
jgi:hypothetical protein